MTSIWYILFLHNRGRWRSNGWTLFNSVFSVAVLFFTMQMFLGIEHFYTVVNSVIAHAKIIKITVTGSYIIDYPSNATAFSFWNPGKQLVISSQSRDLMGTIQTLVNTVLLFVIGLFTGKELLASRHQSKLELESRIADYRVVLDCKLDRAYLVRLATAQKLMFALPTILLGLLLSNLVMVPIGVRYLNQALPGVYVFFYLSWTDMFFLSLPLIGLVAFGILSTVFYSRKMLRRLIC